MGKVIAKALGLILVLIQLVMSLAFIVVLYFSNYLTVDWLLIVALILLVLVLLNLIFQKWLVAGIFGKLFAILICGVLGYGCFILLQTNQTLSNVTAAIKYQVEEVNTYVMIDDPAQTISDAKDYTFGILGEVDRDNTDYTIHEIETELGQSITLKEYDDMSSLAAGLYTQEIGAMIINEAYAAVLSDSEEYSDFDDQVRLLSTVSREIALNEGEVSEGISYTSSDIVEKPFIIYLSGCDQAGELSTKGRSDVNILGIVNPKTKQVLLLSTPRDYYVELSNARGEYDKLTHAGIWGIDVSMDTLGLLYDEDINLYFKVNFTGFKKVINALGTIDVYSDVAFEAGKNASSQSKEKTYTFVEGLNKLDGDAALAFARERHAFASGDNQRGKNQMKVIEGVLKKMQSTALLTNYAEIMDSVSDCFSTNMTKDQIQALVKMQLSDMASWNIQSYAVAGTNASGKTYSSPKLNHYIMKPIPESVDSAKTLIRQVMDGEKLDIKALEGEDEDADEEDEQ